MANNNRNTAQPELDIVCLFCSTSKPRPKPGDYLPLKEISSEQWEFLGDKEVAHDDLPNKICFPCIYWVNRFNEFRKNVNKSVDEWKVYRINKNRTGAEPPMSQIKFYPENKIPCDYCPRTFVDKSGYNKHLRTWHNFCIYCKDFNQGTRSTEDLKEHNRTVHKKCQHCGDSFEKRSGLTNHEKSCVQNPQLDSGEQSHSGEEPGSGLEAGSISETNPGAIQTDPSDISYDPAVSMYDETHTESRLTSLEGSSVQPQRDSLSQNNKNHEETNNRPNPISDTSGANNTAKTNAKQSGKRPHNNTPSGGGAKKSKNNSDLPSPRVDTHQTGDNGTLNDNDDSNDDTRKEAESQRETPSNIDRTHLDIHHNSHIHQAHLIGDQYVLNSSVHRCTNHTPLTIVN